MTKTSIDVSKNERNDVLEAFNPAISKFLAQLSQKVQNSIKPQLKGLASDGQKLTSMNPSTKGEKKGSSSSWEFDVEKQLQAWRENPSWTDKPPQIKVSVPKDTLSKLDVKVDVGLPPDAVYNIVTDPDNKRVFKNIKEVISRRVLIDEGSRQVVELEQAALWRFLWWSGTIAVHVLVDQNRADHSMKFKQLKAGFMKRFEGRWRVEPLFVDEGMCIPTKPKNLEDYNACTKGKGRIGSRVSLEQLIEPAIVPPPPISWYLRGITTRTTEMLILDLLAEAERIRGDVKDEVTNEELQISQRICDSNSLDSVLDIKQRWAIHRRNAKQRGRTRSFLAAK
ncbi:uncharacterized protein LOC111798998 [Cucurbita pepo subsp. pepo]|uniref:uncharacterized protein LOC111798998 n=1 Tax=Cucurbita pepo subsp. pepo TaxID=3664 RepID=UPI000C9D70B1|nr:uncharacterized protein LOC111798998 [Cucurbita pepo subsp. pepo]XP_023538141.1 uncharacterized protein LOC111798998 [Cucurbita pepo subsp. pepo]